MRLTKFAAVSVIVAAVLLLTAVTGWAAPATAPKNSGEIRGATVVPAAAWAVSRPLRSIQPLPPQAGRAPENPGRPHALPAGEQPDPYLQSEVGAGEMPAPIVNFDGTNNINGVYPPDTQGDVGPNHYVEWINLSFEIFDKSGNSLYGPAAGNTLFTDLGGMCATYNQGDPITLYDPLADRWLMSQFVFTNSLGGPYGECIAISATPDPLGAWNLYFFQTSTTKLLDYPKLGVWPDAYYMTGNLFLAPSFAWAGILVAALDRDAMLAGNPATMQMFEPSITEWSAPLPADLDGVRPPPTGAPNYMLTVVDDTWDPANWPNDELHFSKFHVDWVNPANTTYTWPPIVLPISFDGEVCTALRGQCVPQPGTAIKLENLGDRLMHRLAYRNYGDHDAVVVNHTVDIGGGVHGVRWYELRDLDAATPTIYQQGTYGPTDGLHRWMASIAMDHVGNMALGFSTSNGTAPNYPSIAYTGRLVTDPLGDMSQGEAQMYAGTGSQTGSAARWGDYSMMAVDPVDDCTFWYTNEYLQTTGSAPWRTRIASFKFPSCTSPTAVDVTAVDAVPAAMPYALFAVAGMLAAVVLVAALRLRRA